MLDDQEGPDNRSVIETLNRLCSIVEEEPDLHAICNTFRSELSKYCPSEAIELLSYSNDPKELLRIASSTDEPGGSRIRFDDDSSSWIELGKPDALYIFTDVKEAPFFVRDMAEKAGSSSAAIFARRERAGKRTILAVLAKEGYDISSWEKSESLVELLRGSAILLEYCKLISDMNNYRMDFLSLFDLIPIAIIQLDEKGTVKSANNEAELILGSGDPDRGIEEENVFKEESFKKSGIAALVRRALRGEDAEAENIRFRGADGRNRYLFVKLRSIIGSDGKRQIIGILTDVSARIQLQQQLERSYQTLTEAFHELQRADKMKSQFIDVVSHELRTPLTVIRGYLDMISHTRGDSLDPKLAQKLDSISLNTDRLYEIVESMLDSARIEKGAVEVVKQETSLKAMLEEIVASLRGLANEKHQELLLVDVGETGLVQIDTKKMRDALKHIINNAIKYTQDGGKIQVTLTDEGNMIHIMVRDNGIGIPLSEISKIFERFYIVAADELSHQVDRMGLGLPIAKGIIESHGGKIWVESEIGKGTVFHINMPKG